MILRPDNEQQLVINTETTFGLDLGWFDGIQEYEKETLKSIINPTVNFETSRFIHSGYTSSNGVLQNDLWIYFYFYSDEEEPKYYLNYEHAGIRVKDNHNIRKKDENSFFRLEFYKTPNDETPTKTNRKLVFTKHYPIPNGEVINYTPLDTKIFVPVFMGSRYHNKENMYLYWFMDETPFEGSVFSGTTFYITAKYFNTIDGSTSQFLSVPKEYGDDIVDGEIYHKLVMNRASNEYYIYSGATENRVGIDSEPIRYYASDIISTPIDVIPVPIPTPIPTPTPTVPVYVLPLGCGMATTSHPRWDENSTYYGTDNFGFKALPGGYWNGSYDGVGQYSILWTSNEYNATDAVYMYIPQIHQITSSFGDKDIRASVRACRGYTDELPDGTIITGDYTDGDGNTYDGVVIGNQVWTVGNIKSTTNQTGNPLPYGSLWSWYDDDEPSYGDYGLLYNWACIAGGLVGGTWRVPTENDWYTMVNHLTDNYYELDNIGDVAQVLKSCRQVNHPNADAFSLMFEYVPNGGNPYIWAKMSLVSEGYATPFVSSTGDTETILVDEVFTVVPNDGNPYININMNLLGVGEFTAYSLDPTGETQPVELSDIFDYVPNNGDPYIYAKYDIVCSGGITASNLNL